MADEVEPLTPEQEQQRADLNYQAAMVEWQERETAREADLAAMEPVAVALGDLVALDATITALDDAAGNLVGDAANRVRRVAQIMRYDARKLLEQHEQLQVPEAAPVAPEASATA